MLLKLDEEFFLIYKNLLVLRFDFELDSFLINSDCSDCFMIYIKDVNLRTKNLHLSYVYKFSDDQKYVNYLFIK